MTNAVVAQDKPQEQVSPTELPQRVIDLAATLREVGEAKVFDLCHGYVCERMREFVRGRSAFILNDIAMEVLKGDFKHATGQWRTEMNEALEHSEIIPPNIFLPLGRSLTQEQKALMHRGCDARFAIEEALRIGMKEEYTRFEQAQVGLLPKTITEPEYKHLLQEPYRLLDAKEGLAALRPLEMRVENLLLAGTVTIAAGGSNAGKSTVLELLALCISEGLPFGDRRCMQGKVLWVAGEDAYNTELRRQAYVDLLGIDRNGGTENLCILAEPVAIMHPESIARMHLAIAQRGWAEMGKLALLVLDSKSMTWGGDSENSNDENAEFVKILQAKFARRYGCAVIVTHHVTKGNDKNEPTTRGASALVNNADQEWRFSGVQATSDSPTRSVITPGKLRMQRWAPIHAAITTHELSDPRYVHLRDPRLGFAPRISVAEIVNAYGVAQTPGAQKKGNEFAWIIEALVADANASKAALGVQANLVRIEADGETRGDGGKVTSRLERMHEQKLLKLDPNARSGYALTNAGRDFYKSWESERAIVPADDSDVPLDSSEVS